MTPTNLWTNQPPGASPQFLGIRRIPKPQASARRRLAESALAIFQLVPRTIVAHITSGMVVCLLVAGCGVAPQYNLVGEWHYTGRMTPFETKADARGTDSLENHVEWDPGDDESGIRLTFGRWGKLITRTDQGPVHTEKIGSWTWLHFDPARQVGVIQCRLLGQKTDHRVEFLGPDRIRLNPPNLAGLDQELDFEKVR